MTKEQMGELMSQSAKLEMGPLNQLSGMIWAPGDTPIVPSLSSLSIVAWIVKVLGYGASKHDVGFQNSLQYIQQEL